MKRFLSMMTAIAFLLTMSSGCSNPWTAARQNAAASPKAFALGEEIPLLSCEVSPDAALIEVQATEDFPGMKINVPEGSFSQSSAMTISSMPIQANSLGKNYQILTPLIGIETGGEFLAQPLEITIPVEVSDGYVPLAFYYDTQTGDFEAIPTSLQEDGSLKITTSHFSRMVAVSVMRDLLVGLISTDFQVGRDNLQIPNIGTYIASGGMCYGITTATMYYDRVLKKTVGNLYGRYDSLQRDTDGFWQDDRNLIRLASVVQDEAFTENYDQWMQDNWGKSALEHWYMTAYAMLLTGRPQIVVISTTRDNENVSHSLIAYKLEGNKMYVADPNAPANDALYLQMDLKSGAMMPYTGALTADTAPYTFRYMYFIGSSALLNFDRVTQLWQQMQQGSIGDGKYPDYNVYEIITDVGGAEKKVKVGTDHLTTQETLRLRLEDASFSGTLTAYGPDYTVLATAKPGQVLEIPLTAEETVIGLLIGQEGASGSPDPWVDFIWVTVLKATAQQWQLVRTITQVFPGGGYSDEEEAALLGHQETALLYLTWNPDTGIYTVLNPETGNLTEVIREGTRLMSDTTMAVDNVLFTQEFTASVNDEGTRIEGDSVIGSSESGPILKYHEVWTKLE